MSLPHILLTLTKDPVSGYDLNRVIAETISHFWAADQAQVYRHLSALRQQEMLTCTEVASEKGPARKVYQRTNAGHKMLVDWLKSGPQMPPERLAYVAQLVFLWEAADLNVTLNFVGQLRVGFQRKLDELRAIEAEESKAPISTLPVADLHGFLGLKLATDTLTAKVGWCEWAASVIRRRIKKDRHK